VKDGHDKDGDGGDADDAVDDSSHCAIFSKQCLDEVTTVPEDADESPVEAADDQEDQEDPIEYVECHCGH